MSQEQHRIGLTHTGSHERWPAREDQSPGAPNVLAIVLDDVGFAQFGCFGATIETPNIDRLAASGLRYTNFHTTAVCSPTRASLLTGRNPHSVGFGCVTERMAGFPGYSMLLPDSSVTIAEILRRSGYHTRAVGKWHLTPSYETGPQGPFDRWPLGRGFQRFYGFLSGVADQFHPELTRDNSLVEPPCGPEDGYHLSADLVDESITQISDLQALSPNRPFFHYLAFGAAHAPHQVPAEWIERYRGAFDHGWDVERERILARQIEQGVMPAGTTLGESNPGVTPWADLTADERTAFARMMEVYAGFLTHTDAQIGRLLDHLERTRALDNTIVVLLSDNGASAEGGPDGLIDSVAADDGIDATSISLLDDLGGPDLDNHYPWGWAQAGNTPFRWYKQFTHAGGITNGLLLSWPSGGVPAGEIRTQYHHVIDVAPTLLDLIGIEPPAQVAGVTQQPMHGVSMRYSLTDPAADSRRSSQHYEMFGNRGFWRDGWMAISRMHPTPERARPPTPAPTPVAEAVWELYDHRSDPTECHDLAAERPDLLAEMVNAWWAAAGQYQVLPIDERPRKQRFPAQVPLPLGADPDGATFPGPGGPYERGGAPRIAGRSFTLTADITVSDGPTEGVLYAFGGRHGGYAWYVDAGRLVFEVTRSPLSSETVSAELDLAPGPHRLTLTVATEPDRPVTVQLRRDDELLEQGTVTALVARMPVHAGRSHVGRAGDRTASRAFDPPFAFTQQLHSLSVRPGVTSEPPTEPAVFAAEMREQ